MTTDQIRRDAEWPCPHGPAIRITSAGRECVGLNYVETCGTNIEDRTIVRVASDGTTAVAGSTPIEVTSIRITITGNDPIEIRRLVRRNIDLHDDRR